MQRKNILILIVVGLLIVFGIVLSERGQNTEIPTDLGGTELSITFYESIHQLQVQYPGTPLVLNSWATWCPFCVDELLDFVTAQEEFGEQIEIMIVNRKQSPGEALEFLNDIGITNQLDLVFDSRDKFYRDIGGLGMPVTVFVSAEGEIEFTKQGVMTLEEIKERTQNLIIGG
jgi:thiol-disulfide isomerase/thioredoxin